MEGERGVTLKQFWEEYNIYKAIKNIDAAWCEVESSKRNGAWNKLIPQFARDFCGSEEVDAAAQRVVHLSAELQLELEVEDVHWLLESHSEEPTDEDLLYIDRQREEDEATSEGEVVPEKKFTCKQLAEDFSSLDKVLASFESQDTNPERFAKVACRGTLPWSWRATVPAGVLYPGPGGPLCLQGYSTLVLGGHFACRGPRCLQGYSTLVLGGHFACRGTLPWSWGATLPAGVLYPGPGGPLCLQGYSTLVLGGHFACRGPQCLHSYSTLVLGGHFLQYSTLVLDSLQGYSILEGSAQLLYPGPAASCRQAHLYIYICHD
ncbi:hypothetical protein JZ751_009357 [Albula glossodonta]|uniref:Uncharacterized protein n=1 Tax=Albula glossodonta TaxID=121402 RepID=A0A8T2N1G7_9TELE|nr:hypothetical protein JZ751_009357 [Albula glossodonta]